ncbi:MAG: hypothetical protein R3F20_03635 [Planctomycetota bacterium]
MAKARRARRMTLVVGILLGLIGAMPVPELRAEVQDGSPSERFDSVADALVRLREERRLSPSECSALAELISRSRLRTTGEEWNELLERLPWIGDLARPLLGRLERTTDDRSAYQLVLALDAIGTSIHETDARLAHLARDDDRPRLATIAINLLTRHGREQADHARSRLVRLLTVSSSHARRRALDALGTMGPDARPAADAIWRCYEATYVDRGFEESEIAGIRNDALTALGNLGEQPSEFVAALLARREAVDDPDERADLLDIACRIGSRDPKVIEAWTSAASGEDASSVHRAMTAAAPLVGERRVVEMLIDRLGRDESSDVRLEAFRTLRRTRIETSRYRSELCAAIAQPARWGLADYVTGLSDADRRTREVAEAMRAVLTDERDPDDVEIAVETLDLVEPTWLPEPGPETLSAEAAAAERRAALIRLRRDDERVRELREQLRSPILTASPLESWLVLRIFRTEPDPGNIDALSRHLDAALDESRRSEDWPELLVPTALEAIAALGPAAKELRPRVAELWHPGSPPPPLTAWVLDRIDSPPLARCRIEAAPGSTVDRTTWGETALGRESQAQADVAGRWRLIVEDPAAADAGDWIELVFDRNEEEGLVVTAEWVHFDVEADSPTSKVAVTSATLRLPDPAGVGPVIRGRFEIEAGERRAAGSFAFPNPFPPRPDAGRSTR